MSERCEMGTCPVAESGECAACRHRVKPPLDDEWHAEEADAHEAETRARAEYEARWDG